MSGQPLVGEFNTVPATVGSGQKTIIQTDDQGRLITTGTGTGGLTDVEIFDSNREPLDYTIPAETVQDAATSAAVTSVNSLATNQTLLAATSTRLHASIYNSDANTLYIKYGATATTSDYSYAITTGSTWDMPYRYVGIIDGIWAADGAGAAKITSLLNV